MNRLRLRQGRQPGCRTKYAPVINLRIMPNLKRVGLLTDKVRPKYEALGALRYEDMAGDVMIDWAQLERPLPTKQNLEAARTAAE